MDDSNALIKNDFLNKKESHQSNHGSKRSSKKKHSSSSQFKDSLKKDNSNIENTKSTKITESKGSDKCKSKTGEQLKIEFCSRHEIESINHSSTKTNIFPKELMERIRNLPSAIDKTNAFLAESIHGAEGEKGKHRKKPSKVIRATKCKSRHKLVTHRNKMPRYNNCEPLVVAACSEMDSMNDAKNKISTYLQSFISKPLSECPEILTKSKSYSCPKEPKIKTSKKSTQLKGHTKNYIPVHDDSKHNLRADYIQWLLAEKKFFNIVECSLSDESNISKKKHKVQQNETSEKSERVKPKSERSKKTKRLRSHRKDTTHQQPALIESGPISTTNSSDVSKQTGKNYEIIFNEVMSKRNFSLEQLRHIRWLASVENIIHIKSKEFIRRTISLNELYSYIPTHDGDDRFENLLHQNQKGPYLKEIESVNCDQFESINKPTKNYQRELYTAATEKNFTGAFIQSLPSRVNYEIIPELKESTESVESLSIAIKKTNNVFDSCGSLNIEIFHNNEISSRVGQSKLNDHNAAHNNERCLPNNVYNENEYSSGGIKFVPSLSYCPLFSTSTNILTNNHEVAHSISISNTDYDYDAAYNLNPIDESEMRSQKRLGEGCNQNKTAYKSAKTVNNLNDLIHEKIESKNRQRANYNENEPLNLSYATVSNRRSKVTNPERIQLTEKKDEFSQLISSAQINLYGRDTYSYHSTPEQNSTKFSFDECNSYADQSYTENIAEQGDTDQNPSVNCSSSNNDEKQNEILHVMGELKEKINVIQDQISFMNINCTKCENIEMMLMKLKKDVAYGLKHVESKLKEMDHGHNDTDKSERKSETNILKTENANKHPKVIKSLNSIKITPLGVTINDDDDDDDSKSQFYEISGKDHKIFYDTLGSLTNQLKQVTSNEKDLDKILCHDQYAESKEVGLMTEENPTLCNYCCIYVKTTLKTPGIPIVEKETQCDITDGIKEFSIEGHNSEFVSTRSNRVSTLEAIDTHSDSKVSKKIRNEKKESKKRRILNKLSGRSKNKQCLIL